MVRSIVIGDLKMCEDVMCSEECEKCFCYAKDGVFAMGCFKDGKMYVPFIISGRRGGMKRAITELARVLGARYVVFTSVLSKDLVDALMKRRELVRRVELVGDSLVIEVEWDAGA